MGVVEGRTKHVRLPLSPRHLGSARAVGEVVTQHILLTGAGFSRNWGGWLVAEAFEYLLGHPLIDDGLRTLLWKHKDPGFEAAVDELRTKPRSDQERKLDSAIRDMFKHMNEKFADRGYLDFYIESPVTELLDKCDAIFTLNQDLLLEQLYRNDASSMLERPWHMPGMEPKSQPPGTAIKDVTEWREMSEFAVVADSRPYFKLHGSSNWIDTRSGKPLLIIGGHKPQAINRHPILKWSHKQF